MAGDFIQLMKNQTAIDPSAGVAFTAAATDICTASTHGFVTGDGPFYLTTSDTLPAGLEVDTLYWLVKLTADTFSFAKTKRDAKFGNVIDITDTGTGTHAMHWDHWYDVSKYALKSVHVAGLAAGDEVSIMMSNLPTKPATDDYGVAVAANITADGWLNLTGGIPWIRSYLSVSSGSATAAVYFWGQKHTYG